MALLRTICGLDADQPAVSHHTRSVRAMHYARYLRTHAEPVGITTLTPMRFGTVAGETYGGELMTIPVAVVSRAPAPPDRAAWLCVRQNVGPEQHWFVWVPAESVRPS